MEVLNGDGRSTWIIEAIDCLDAKCKHDGNIEHKSKNEDGENSHPGGCSEVALAVEGTCKDRIMLFVLIEWAISLDLCVCV